MELGEGRDAKRVCYHHRADLLYVCGAVSDCWDHRELYCDPVCRVKGQAYLYCWGDEELFGAVIFAAGKRDCIRGGDKGLYMKFCI